MTSSQMVELSEYKKYYKGLSPQNTHTHMHNQGYTEDVLLQPLRQEFRTERLVLIGYMFQRETLR